MGSLVIVVMGIVHQVVHLSILGLCGLSLSVEGVDLPRLDQALLLLRVCVGYEFELCRGKGARVDSVLGHERVECLVPV